MPEPHARQDTALPSAEAPPRVRAIPGCHNLRDMGGYRTSDGRRLRWNMLFRSGVMHGLAEADCDEIRQLGIRTIYDLRGNKERERRPTEWHIGTEIEYYSRDYDLSAGNLSALRLDNKLTREMMIGAVHAIYRKLPFEQADSYSHLFRLLIAGRLPLLFNCSAGKDRTGIAAALILHALGVSREDIEQDYLLTEQAIDQLIAIFFNDRGRAAELGNASADDFLPLLTADPAYIRIAFDEIELRHGSVDIYLEAVLGVGPAEIAILRENLLE